MCPNIGRYPRTTQNGVIHTTLFVAFSGLAGTYRVRRTALPRLLRSLM
jgi:hypothetical protein